MIYVETIDPGQVHWSRRSEHRSLAAAVRALRRAGGAEVRLAAPWRTLDALLASGELVYNPSTGGHVSPAHELVVEPT